MLNVRINDELVTRIDGHRGQMPRERWVRHALGDYMDRMEVAAARGGGHVSEPVDDHARARARSSVEEAPAEEAPAAKDGPRRGSASSSLKNFGG